MTTEELIEIAKRARTRAYAPYSNFAVGAALITRTGEVFEGCNVENISFGLTICAERSTVFSAVGAGFRDFAKIVIVADTRDAISPCGACRQVLAEFAPDLRVISCNLDGLVFESSLSELLPRAKTGILNSPCST